MKTRLKIKSAVLIFLAIIRYTEGLTWNTHMRSAVCCQCEKQLLIWNFTKEENERVTGLHWFFNETTLVCFASNVTGFMVANLYAGRVERNGTAGIQLKNVSLNDTGEYTLYVKLEEETKRNVQGINLTVVEPPPRQCKPIIKKEHYKGIISCSTSCERSPLSVEWYINGTKASGDIGTYYVVNSSETTEQPICCLRDFKCLDYQTKFCTQNNISFTEDEHTVIQSLADTNCMVSTPISIFLIVAVVILIIVVIALCVILYRRRIRLFYERGYTKTLTRQLQCGVLLPDDTYPMFLTDQEPHANVHDVEVPDKQTPSPLIVGTDQEPDAAKKLDQRQENSYDIMLKRLQELEAKVHHIQEQDAVEPKHANTVAQCSEDLQQVTTVAGTTDRPLQDSNRHVQIVNSIIIDTDFLKNILPSNTALMAGLQANAKDERKGAQRNEDHHQVPTIAATTDQPFQDSNQHDQVTNSSSSATDLVQSLVKSITTLQAELQETRKLKRQLRRKTDLQKKENRLKYSLAITQVECSDFKNNETDTFDTAESEDSFSDNPVHEASKLNNNFDISVFG